jgi:hypothetical protein
VSRANACGSNLSSFNDEGRFSTCKT